MEIFVLFLLGSLQVGSALDIMACNCSQAEIVGLMDIQRRHMDATERIYYTELC